MARPTSSTKPPQGPLRRPTSNDVRQGSVLWLGTQTDTLNSFAHRGHAKGEPVERVRSPVPVDDGLYSHPILALSRSASNPDKVIFALITSFTARGHQLSKKKEAFYIPLAPAPDTRKHLALTFENNDELTRPSWVCITHIYSMHWQDTELYWGDNPSGKTSWTLDYSSIRRVLAGTSLSLDTQYQVTHSAALRYSPPFNSTPPSRMPVSRSEYQRPAIQASTAQVAPVDLGLPYYGPVGTLYEGYVGRTSVKVQDYYPAINEEERPLLPRHRTTGSPQDVGGNKRSFWHRICSYLAETRLGIIIRYLFG